MPLDESKETPRDVIEGMRRFVQRERFLDIGRDDSDAKALLESMYQLILSYARRMEDALNREGM